MYKFREQKILCNKKCTSPISSVQSTLHRIDFDEWASARRAQKESTSRELLVAAQQDHVIIISNAPPCSMHADPNRHVQGSESVFAHRVYDSACKLQSFASVSRNSAGFIGFVIIIRCAGG